MAKCRINTARVLKIILTILLQDIFLYNITIFLDNLYTWNPNDPCFGRKHIFFEKFTFKNRGHVGSGPSVSTATCTMFGHDMTGPNILQMYTLLH